MNYHKQHLYITVLHNLPIGKPFYIRQNEKEELYLKTENGTDNQNQPFNCIRLSDAKLTQLPIGQPIDPIECDINYRTINNIKPQPQNKHDTHQPMPTQKTIQNPQPQPNPRNL